MKMTLLSLAAALLLFLPAAALAASRNSANVTLTSPAMVGNTQLKAGNYKVEWSGNGPQVQAKFLQDNKLVATAPATLELQSSPYEQAVQVKTLANKSDVLHDIYWKHFTLKFGRAG